MTEDKKMEEMPVEFNGLILGFSSAALYYLGHTAIDDSGEKELNLPLAKQNIDIIALLKEKTSGNLGEEEIKLINDLLLDLRQKYIAAK